MAAPSTPTRTDSYITLTPRSNEPAPPSSSSLAKELLTKKWAAAKKKSLPRDTGAKESLSAVVAKDAKESANEKEHTDSPTETDRTSDVESDVDAPEQDDEDLEAAEAEMGQLATYLCELHDPKPMLKAEHIRPNRVEISLITAPKAVTLADKDKRLWGWHSNNVFRYEISVGMARTVFECTPSRVLDVLKTLSHDRNVVEQLRLIETNYFREGILGSIKRLYPSAIKLSKEIVDVLEFISDIDQILLHPIYLDLIGVTKGTVFYKELEEFVTSHNHPCAASPRDNATGKCLCDTYLRSVDHFVDLFKQHAEDEDGGRFSVVASESLMWSRGILSFYTDTVYMMDKRDFRPWRGLNKCTIYGFGRRRLFEIVRTSRKEWSFRHVNYGAVATLTIERYMHKMNPYHMVAIKRVVPEGQKGAMREENICFVKKSKKTHGYRVLLMSEVITRGRVTTSLTIEQAKTPEGDVHNHYVTMSEVSGAARESVCSSTLSVPMCHYKNCQQLHVSGGSDVVAFLCLAASYDILVGGMTYWKEKRY